MQTNLLKVGNRNNALYFKVIYIVWYVQRIWNINVKPVEELLLWQTYKIAISN